MAEAAKIKKKKVLSEEAKKRIREYARIKAESRINIGTAFTRWRELKEEEGFPTDAALALFLLDWSDQCNAQMASTQVNTEQMSGAAGHESVQPETSERGESEKRDTADERLKSPDERTNQSENGDMTEDEELSTTLSVADGRYLVDLGSPSEVIVDEKCILQLFNSCQKCRRQCRVKKRVTGLKLVLIQACWFCESRSMWTNLPDDDDDDFQTNGKNTAHGQSR